MRDRLRTSPCYYGRYYCFVLFIGLFLERNTAFSLPSSFFLQETIKVSSSSHFSFTQRSRQCSYQKGYKSRFATSVSSSAISSTKDSISFSSSPPPQVFATGYSSAVDLNDAVREATRQALASLPQPEDEEYKIRNTTVIDLAFISISSIYDGGKVSPSTIVPTVLQGIRESPHGGYPGGIQALIGSYSGGIIASKEVFYTASHDKSMDLTDDKQIPEPKRACKTLESEGLPGVVVTFSLLPDTTIQTFHVMPDDVPDDIGRISPKFWMDSVGLRGFLSHSQARAASMTTSATSNMAESSSPPPPVVMILPSPSFQSDIDNFLRGLTMAFGPEATVFGGIASTVSSLSRARLFRYDVKDPGCIQTIGEGCVGVALQGDVQVKVMIAQGAKPVGPIYRVITGQGSTVGAIQMDDLATQHIRDEGALDYDNTVIPGKESVTSTDEEEDESNTDAKSKMAAAYAKANIPKPVLAEANFLLKTLSDDDQTFMRKVLLLGLERNTGNIARSPNELIRLAQGQGHRFTVHQVASAGMKDGSVTFPLGTVLVEKGTRVRFFVRDGKFAKREVEALMMGYKKRELEAKFQVESDASKQKSSKLSYQSTSFTPTGCFLLPTLDRGSKFFGGKEGFESKTLTDFIPSLPSVSGFFTNGVLGKFDESDSSIMVIGSASCYALWGSRSGRPIFSAAMSAEKRRLAQELAVKKNEQQEDENRNRGKLFKGFVSNYASGNDYERAPRSDNGELILKRREVHSGRALTVSSVEWSVAEKAAKPTSVLEGFMWDKETEVDRLRERVPLSNLVSQCKLASTDPASPKPRDWIGAVKFAFQVGSDFVVIPELKRLEPTYGSLRKRYNVSKLARLFAMGEAPALCVNCDGILFGGSPGDLSVARESSVTASLGLVGAEDGVVPPPILASDLILYPYQLYKLRLAGADAIQLVLGALTTKDLFYLCKIATSLGMQTVLSVTSEAQIRMASALGAGSISAVVVSNRDLEYYTYDETGKQALKLLKSDAMLELRTVYGTDFPVLVEGRVGLITSTDSNGVTSSANYIQSLRDAGAIGAIVGGALSLMREDDGPTALKGILKDICS